MQAGYHKNYKYPPNTHWTAILKRLIKESGLEGKITWKEAIKELYMPYKLQHPNSTRIIHKNSKRIKKLTENPPSIEEEIDFSEDEEYNPNIDTEMSYDAIVHFAKKDLTKRDLGFIFDIINERLKDLSERNAKKPYKHLHDAILKYLTIRKIYASRLQKVGGLSFGDVWNGITTYGPYVLGAISAANVLNELHHEYVEKKRK